MVGYNVLLSNSKNIEENRNDIISMCEIKSGKELSAYFNYSFSFSTGYMNTVRDEIYFVLQSQQQKNYAIIDDVLFFAKKWGLDFFLDYKISELSGGWRKFLGIALFSNIRSEGRIYFDCVRQLSDRLIGILIDNLSEENKIFFFVEYDSELIKLDTIDKLIFNDPNFKNEFLTETNYVKN